MMVIAQTPFVVVDTETTGTSPSMDRIIEIGAVKIHDGEIVEKFDQLINPGILIPSRITRLTHITNGMVFDKPGSESVLPDFMHFLGDAVLVAHNLSFDVGFLNAELNRMGAHPIDNTSLCTLRLARRLLKGLRSKGLSALAAFYGIKITGRHRALGDAKATAEILLRFIDRLAEENGIVEKEDLIRFQFTTYAPRKGTRKRLVELRDTCVPDIPEKPGVYQFMSKRGQVIYVGKAKNLRARVRTYFTSIEAHSSHTRKLVEHIQAIEWHEMDSELEALIEESRRIKCLKPKYNRAQRFYRNRPFIRLSVHEEFPTATLTSYLVDDGSEYFGPLRGKQEGKMVLDLINRFFLLRECGEGTFRKKAKCLYHDLQRCSAPCITQVAPNTYALEVERVKDFLLGKGNQDLIDTLQAAMVSASVEMDYEEAALYRDLGDLVVRLMARQECIAAPVLQHNAVVIDRSIDDGLCRMLLVRYGRLLETVSIPIPPDKHHHELLSEHINNAFVVDTDRPERYYKAEIEEIRLLAHWLYVHRDDALKVDFLPEMTSEELVGIVWSQFVSTF